MAEVEIAQANSFAPSCIENWTMPRSWSWPMKRLVVSVMGLLLYCARPGLVRNCARGAGTYDPVGLIKHAVARASATTQFRGYGSRICASLVRDDTCVAAAFSRRR
ncbi:hypothetical protein TM233_55000 [Bradyrhizobium sp. TM233]|nr:hypothetical protein TM233_55000 [Bradyrhizobium sp. TM233]